MRWRKWLDCGSWRTGEICLPPQASSSIPQHRPPQCTCSLTSFGTDYWCLGGRCRGRTQQRAWQTLQGLCSISLVSLSRKTGEYTFIEVNTSYTQHSPVLLRGRWGPGAQGLGWGGDGSPCFHQRLVLYLVSLVSSQAVSKPRTYLDVPLTW